MDVVCTFSGCPGGAPGDTHAQLGDLPLADRICAILEYQWTEVLVPYWRRKSAEARNEGVRIALEAHPGFAVYNPGDAPEAARPWPAITSGPTSIRRTFSGRASTRWRRPASSARPGRSTTSTPRTPPSTRTIPRVNGVLDTKSYGDLARRSWVFRTCGYGHGDDFLEAVRQHAARARVTTGRCSIEHEDSYMSMQEGFGKAVSYLKSVLIADPPGAAWWF